MIMHFTSVAESIGQFLSGVLPAEIRQKVYDIAKPSLWTVAGLAAVALAAAPIISSYWSEDIGAQIAQWAGVVTTVSTAVGAAVSKMAGKNVTLTPGVDD